MAEDECCPLFTEALGSGGSLVEGFSFERSGETGLSYDRRRYAFRIPAKGRGGERKPARSLYVSHCPFCGTSPPRAREAGS